MNQMTNGNNRQGSPINGEEIVRKLELLLERYEDLDENTVRALERAFGTYKKLRPGVFTDVTSYVSGGMSKVASWSRKAAAEKKPAEPKSRHPLPIKKQAAADADEIRKKLEAHAGKLSRACMEAEKALAEAKVQYAHQKQVLAVYEQTVEPFLEPFKKAMQSLIYFAACADPEICRSAMTPLRNKSRALKNGLQPGMWGEHLDEAHLSRIEQMFAVESAAPVFQYRPETDPDVKARITAYTDRIKAAETQKKPYDTENPKLANRIKQAELLWEYVNLLRRFLPVIETIAGTAEEQETAQWASEVGTALLDAVQAHGCRNEKMKFLWVYPHGELSQNREEIAVQFVAAELDCPGLYYSFEENQDGLKRLGCVFPGCSGK